VTEDTRNRQLQEALERWFGFSSLRPMQKEAVDAALDGKDALVVLPTGGGKSLCYQLPPLVMDRLTVVVSPLIALMQDQVDGLRLNGVPAAASHSNLDAKERARLRELTDSGELRILFIAPERLFLADFLSWLAEQDVAAIAIDEAHCISQWGHDFRPEYRRLAELRTRLPGVPVHAYTATATPRVRQDIREQLQLEDCVELVGTFDRPELTYRVLPRQGLIDQVTEGIGRHGSAATIIYCISRKDTETLAKQLRSRDIEAEAYHAGLPAGERTRISADFRAERCNVVCATVAFGMGIDRSDVRLVVHAAMPKSIEHYQQETGRAGRDGLPSECLMLYSGADGAKWRMIMQRAGEEHGDTEATKAQLGLLGHMQRFAGRVQCRHRTLSEYFGQSYDDPSCGACDVCLDELEVVPDSHVTAQKILSAVARTGQRFGASYVIDVLRGSKSEKVLSRGHDQIPTFGLLKSLPQMRLGNYIDQLIDEGVLVRTDGEYPVLVLNEASAEVLRGTRELSLRSPKGGLDQPARRRRRGSSGSTPAQPLTTGEQEVFDRLRALRRKLASSMGVPPYVVFSDATLEELARQMPASRSAMLEVKGIGPKKYDSFGEQFLAALSESS
jgi:ATP-dependent DNA helicase RecQ